MAGTPVKDINGYVIFSDKSINFYSASIRIADQQANFSGKVTLDTSEPVFNLKVKTDRFDLAKVLPNVPLKGPLSFKGTVAGTMAKPSVMGAGRSKTRRAGGAIMFRT